MNDEKGLVRQTDNEKIFAMLKDVEKRRIKEEKQNALKKQREMEGALECKSNRFQELFFQLANSYLWITKRQMEEQNLGMEGYRQLVALVAKKVGLGHKVAILCFKFWNFLFIPCFKADQKDDFLGAFAFAMITGSAFFGIPLLLAWLTGSLPLVSFVSILSIIAVFVPLIHHNGLTERCIEDSECDECRYLFLRGLLKRRLGSGYFRPRE